MVKIRCVQAKSKPRSVWRSRRKNNKFKRRSGNRISIPMVLNCKGHLSDLLPWFVKVVAMLTRNRQKRVRGLINVASRVTTSKSRPRFKNRGKVQAELITEDPSNPSTTEASSLTSPVPSVRQRKKSCLEKTRKRRSTQPKPIRSIQKSQPFIKRKSLIPPSYFKSKAALPEVSRANSTHEEDESQYGAFARMSRNVVSKPSGATSAPAEEPAKETASAMTATPTEAMGLAPASGSDAVPASVLALGQSPTRSRSKRKSPARSKARTSRASRAPRKASASVSTRSQTKTADETSVNASSQTAALRQMPMPMEHHGITPEESLGAATFNTQVMMFIGSQHRGNASGLYGDEMVNRDGNGVYNSPDDENVGYNWYDSLWQPMSDPELELGMRSASRFISEVNTNLRLAAISTDSYPTSQQTIRTSSSASASDGDIYGYIRNGLINTSPALSASPSVVSTVAPAEASYGLAPSVNESNEHIDTSDVYNRIRSSLRDNWF